MPIVIRAPRLSLAHVRRETGMRGNIYVAWRPGETPYVGQSIVDVARAVKGDGDWVHVSTLYRIFAKDIRSAGFRGRRFRRDDLRELNALLENGAAFVVNDPDAWEICET